MAPEHAYVRDLQVNDKVADFYLVRSKSLRPRKTGEPFLSLALGDVTGTIPAIMWDGFAAVEPRLGEGDFVKVQGVVGLYQDQPQMVLQRLRLAQPAEVDLADFVPRTSQDVGALLAALREAAAAVHNPHLRALLAAFLDDAAFAGRFVAAPGAKGIHHAYLGGLIEHTLSVVQVCRRMAEHYAQVDRDLLVASAILHDIGKVEELTWEGSFDYSDPGRLLGHITLGALLVEERLRALPGFPAGLRLRLLHAILSHHGELALGSPKEPMTLEALILHHVEDLDAKVEIVQRALAEQRDPKRQRWTTYHKTLERFLYAGPEGEGGQGGDGP
jgi:3'-5' exoribonuclease